MDRVTIAGRGLSVAVHTKGAELASLKDGDGREWLWQGDAASWPRQAPILFPIVGRAANDVLLIDGKSYPMAQHGFARDSQFTVAPVGKDHCRLTMAANDATRAIYPFDFTLSVDFRIAGTTLTQTIAVHNAGPRPMPASVGFHPGFVWPVPGSRAAQTDHAILFERPESGLVRRIVDGRLSAATELVPIDGNRLPATPDLFTKGAIVLDRPVSRSVWFGVPAEPGVRVDFPAMPDLAFWMVPGAKYLCIEPWQGHHAPEGFAGEMSAMPGMMNIAPGETAERGIAITIAAPEMRTSGLQETKRRH
jgi:galactose mutarotase-like enzyme